MKKLLLFLSLSFMSFESFGECTDAAATQALYNMDVAGLSKKEYVIAQKITKTFNTKYRNTPISWHVFVQQILPDSALTKKEIQHLIKMARKFKSAFPHVLIAVEEIEDKGCDYIPSPEEEKMFDQEDQLDDVLEKIACLQFAWLKACPCFESFKNQQPIQSNNRCCSENEDCGDSVTQDKEYNGCANCITLMTQMADYLNHDAEEAYKAQSYDSSHVDMLIECLEKLEQAA